MSPSQQMPAMASPHSSSSSGSSTSSSPPPPQMANNAPPAQGAQRKPISEHRRCNKPIMEKKRRQRINNCLEELKNLILDALKKDPARHSKLEKADILEMTVRHLDTLHKQQKALAAVTDPNVLNKYRAGFNECASEVDKFLGRSDVPQLDPHIRRRLLMHLSNCTNNLSAAEILPAAKPVPEEAASPVPAAQQRTLRLQIPASTLQIPATVTADGQQMMHLVQTRLPSGDIAFILPKSARSPSVQPSQFSPQYSPQPPPLLHSENPQKLTARTAVVAPLTYALDLSMVSVMDPNKMPPKFEPEPEPMNVESEDVWRPW